MRKFNASQLKLFMALVMVLDHLDHVPYFISSEMAMILHVLTRCVGVWFAYMVVEGFKYTRNKVKYNIRIGSWAIFMSVGNLLFEFLFRSKEIHFYNNIFLTLALSVLVLNLIYEFNKSRLWVKVIRVVGILATIIGGFMLGAEGFVTILPFIIITYLTKDKPKVRNIAYLIFSLLLFSISYVHYEDFGITISMLAMNSDFMFITVLPFIYLYNGERGNNSNTVKYFFYIFYPAHLWILGTIAYFVK